MSDDDNKDKLDLVVAHLKANAIDPIPLHRVPAHKANAIDHGPDE